MKLTCCFTNRMTSWGCAPSFVDRIFRKPQTSIFFISIFFVTSFWKHRIHCFSSSNVWIPNSLSRRIALLNTVDGKHAIWNACTREDLPVGTWIFSKKKIEILYRITHINWISFWNFNYTNIYGPESTNEVVVTIEVVVIPCDVELTKIEWYYNVTLY